MLKMFKALFLSVSIICAFFISNGSIYVSAINSAPSEIVSLRSECGKYFDNGDGSITAYVSTSAIHYFENNEWKNIDNTLILDENGNLSNKSNSTKITIPSNLDFSPLSSEKNNNFTIKHDKYSLSMNLIDASFYSSSKADELIKAEVINEKNDKAVYNNDAIAELVNESCNLVSKVAFESDISDYLLELSVTPDSLIEFLEIKDYINLNELSYYISADNLIAIKEDDNSIQFVDKNKGNIAFIIPPIYIEDSSSDTKIKRVNTTINQTKNGYVLSLLIDDSWLESEANYPVRLISEVTINTDASTFYISEANPTATYQDYYMLFGGSSNFNNSYESIIYKPIFIPNATDKTTIKNAELCVYMLGNNGMRSNLIVDACTINNFFTYPQWVSCGSGNVDSTIVSKTYMSEQASGYHSFDITKAVQSDLNYVRSGGYVGLYCYGFKLKAFGSSVLRGFSERFAPFAPYFEVTYVTNSNYETGFFPNKFNDIYSNTGSMQIYNFQNRMNCYAYALQVYYRSNIMTDTYKLKPGEFGISQTSSLLYPISTFSDLKSYYEEFNASMAETENNNEKQSISKDYMNFVEEQMFKDAAALSFSITPLDTYSSPYYVINNDFVLPNNFNPNNERIIAFVSSYNWRWNYILGDYEYFLDPHYYLRNGNGTCTNPYHSSNCSKWTNKPGLKEVIDTCETNDNIMLCDENIGDYANEITHCTYTNGEVRYYRITKDLNIYNSWHGNGQYDNSTGTPYRP